MKGLANTRASSRSVGGVRAGASTLALLCAIALAVGPAETHAATGRLRVARLRSGPHRLAIAVRRRSGRVVRTGRVLYVSSHSTSKGGGGKQKEPAPEAAPQPEPAPEEPAPEPLPNLSADLLFDGSRLSAFAQLQAAPGAITEVADPLGSGATNFRFTVKDSDVYPITPTEDPRAQALSTSFIKSGDEIWLKTKFMLPSDLPSVPGWMSLVSIYGPPFDGPSPWRIGIDSNELHWQRNGSYGYDVPWRMPLVRGRWITVLLHERFASDGWVEMWIDGAQIAFFATGGYNPDHHPQTERLAMATMDSSNDGGSNHAKIMQYRQAGMFNSTSVYFGPLRVGTSRASVGG